jgi:large subunit ribosomal protein L6
MGRIGKRIIEVPKGVEVKIDHGKITIKGPKGSLEQDFNMVVKVEFKDGTIQTISESKDPKVAAMLGLYNSLITNMIIGVTEGYEKELEMLGVGYRAIKQGKNIQLAIGYSHPVIIEPPDGIELETIGANKIKVKGLDKQVVGEIAAEIRRVRKVEPYKGKGIRYVGEKVRRKAGKAAKAAAGA